MAGPAIVDTVQLGSGSRVLAPPVPPDLRAFAAGRALAPRLNLGALRTPPLPTNTRPVPPPDVRHHAATRFRPWLRTAVLASMALAAGVAAEVATSTPAIAPPAPPPSQSVVVGPTAVPRAPHEAVTVALPQPAPRPVNVEKTAAAPRPGNVGKRATARPTDVEKTAPTSRPAGLAAEGRAVDAQAARVEKLAESLGISPSLLSRGDGRLTSSLEKLPPDVRQMYRGLAPHFKQMIVSRLQGSTQVLFVTVNHRDAFISGSAAGHNTFDFLQDKLRETRQEGTIDASTASGLSKALDAFRQMSPSQRAAVVGLLEQDVARAR